MSVERIRELCDRADELSAQARNCAKQGDEKYAEMVRCLTEALDLRNEAARLANEIRPGSVPTDDGDGW